MTTNTQNMNGASTDTIPGSQDVDALMASKALEIVTKGYSGMNAIGIPIEVPAFTVLVPVDTWLTQASACGLPVDFFIDAITATAKDRILKDKLFAAQLELTGINMSGRPRTSAINEQAKKLEAIISAQTKIDEAENGNAETKLRREDVLFLEANASLDYVGPAYSWYTHDWVNSECMNDACECGATETVNQHDAWVALLESAHYNVWSLSQLGGAMRECLNVKDNQYINLGHPEFGKGTATVTYTLESTVSMPFGGLVRGFNLYQFDNHDKDGTNSNSRMGWTGTQAYTERVDGVDVAISERLAVQRWIGADASEYYDAEGRNNAQAVVKRLKDALRCVGLANANAVWNGALRTWEGSDDAVLTPDQRVELLPASVKYADNNSTTADNYTVERFLADLQALRVEYREPNTSEYNYLSKWLYVGTKARQYSIGNVFTDAEKAKAERNAVPNSGVQAGIA